MIDRDGIERPDSVDAHVMQIKNQTRTVKFDNTYDFRPRNVFFRMWAATFRALAISVFNPYMLFNRHMVTFGGENKKKMRHKPFIMTSNHVSYFDDLSIGTNLFAWRKIYFTTLDQNIRRPAIGFFLRSLGGIPIPVESISGMKKFNEDITYLLKKGKPVLYNPEGSLWPNYRDIRPFKRGAFTMAVKNDVPVLPIVLLFKRRKKRNNKYKYYFHFAICKPVEIDKSLPDEHSRSEKLMKTVYETTQRVAQEWYEIQNCGFDGDENKPVLKPGKELKFKDDKWIVTQK